MTRDHRRFPSVSRRWLGLVTTALLLSACGAPPASSPEGDAAFTAEGTGTAGNALMADYTWQSIAAGGHHTVGLKSDGRLWAWGYNSFGQLGDGTTTSRLTPVQVGSGFT